MYRHNCSLNFETAILHFPTDQVHGFRFRVHACLDNENCRDGWRAQRERLLQELYMQRQGLIVIGAPLTSVHAAVQGSRSDERKVF